MTQIIFELGIAVFMQLSFGRLIDIGQWPTRSTELSWSIWHRYPEADVNILRFDSAYFFTLQAQGKTSAE